MGKFHTWFNVWQQKLFHPCLQRHLDQPSSSDHHYKHCDSPETTDSASCKHLYSFKVSMLSFFHLFYVYNTVALLTLCFHLKNNRGGKTWRETSCFPTSSIIFCSIILPCLVSSPFLVSLSHSLFPLPPPYTMSKVRQSEPGSQNCQHCSR